MYASMFAGDLDITEYKDSFSLNNADFLTPITTFVPLINSSPDLATWNTFYKKD